MSVSKVYREKKNLFLKKENEIINDVEGGGNTEISSKALIFISVHFFKNKCFSLILVY